MAEGGGSQEEDEGLKGLPLSVFLMLNNVSVGCCKAAYVLMCVRVKEDCVYSLILCYVGKIVSEFEP